MAPRKVEHIEFEYVRHGTSSFMFCRDVVTGQAVTPFCGLTRTEAAFLSDPSHRIVFRYTPKHCSWLNQIEIWFSILVRKLLKRGSFTSVEHLKAKVLEFIKYYNRNMTKPCTSTHQGKPLAT